MNYLGGKSRIAREIAEIVNDERGGRLFWDPFCGGLSVAAALAHGGGPGIVSDAFTPLISLYSAVAGGWAPPESLTEAEYSAAKHAPDSDPIKAFAGFGCSFGGKWFGGYARSLGRNYAAETRRALLKRIEAIRGCALGCVDFLGVEPHAREIVIYADPPYAGATSYALAFDSARFWERVRSWERVGVPVFVSEYACPVPHRVVWEKTHSLSVCGGSRSAARVERLFRVLV